MSQLGGAISLAQDTPALAQAYEQAGVLQFHHGKPPGAFRLIFLSHLQQPLEHMNHE